MAICENELVFSSRVWDVEFVGRRIIIREQMRKVLVDIEFNLPEGLRIRRGRLLWNGIELLVTENWAAILNNRALLVGNSIVGCAVGLVLGADNETMRAAFLMSGIWRRGCNRTEAVRWAKQRALESGID